MRMAAPRTDLQLLGRGPAILCYLLLGGLAVLALGMPLQRILALGLGDGALRSWRWVATAPEIRNAALVTLKYWAATVPAQVLLGTLAALTLYQLHATGHKLTAGLLGFTYFIPYAVPPAANRIAWGLLLGEHSPLSLALEHILGTSSTYWFGDGLFYTMAAASVWQFTPFVLVMVLPQLIATPTDELRTAQVDGADFWSRMLYVLLPSAWPAIWRAALMRSLFMLTKFDTPYLFSGSTVNRAGRVVSIAVQEEAVGFFADSATRAAVLALALALGALAAVGVLVGCHAVLLRLFRRIRPLLHSMIALEVRARRRFAPITPWLLKSILWCLVLFSLLPVVALLLGSLAPDTCLSRGLTASSLQRLTGAHYAEVLTDTHQRYLQMAANTLIVSFSTVALTVFAALVGAYALTRRAHILGRLIDGIPIVGYLFPPVALNIGYIALFNDVGLKGSHAVELVGLTLANIALCLPYALWLMVGYMKRIPRNFDMTAAIDRASWGHRLSSIIGPLALPGIIGVAVSAFVLSWNDIGFALVLANQSSRPLAPGLSLMLKSENVTGIGDYAAASVLASAAALFLCATGYIASLRSWKADKHEPTPTSEVH